MKQSWPDIEQTIASRGTLNPDVINIMKVLLSIHKADQKKGKKGEQRKEKTQRELGVLKLSFILKQKLIKDSSDKINKGIEKMLKEEKATESLLSGAVV